MKLNDSFVSKQVCDDFVMISTQSSIFNGIVNGNDSALFIVECLKNDTTRDDIIKKMVEKYDAPQQILADDVDKVLLALRGISAIDE